MKWRSISLLFVLTVVKLLPAGSSHIKPDEIHLNQKDTKKKESGGSHLQVCLQERRSGLHQEVTDAPLTG